MGGLGVVQVFIPGHLEDRPTTGVNAYDSSGSKSFSHEIGLEADLDAAASKGDIPFRLGDGGENPLLAIWAVPAVPLAQCFRVFSDEASMAL